MKSMVAVIVKICSARLLYSSARSRCSELSRVVSCAAASDESDSVHATLKRPLPSSLSSWSSSTSATAARWSPAFAWAHAPVQAISGGISQSAHLDKTVKVGNHNPERAQFCCRPHMCVVGVEKNLPEFRRDRGHASVRPPASQSRAGARR